MYQLKFSLKSETTFWLDGDGLPGPMPWLRPCLRPQKSSLTEKIRPVMPILPSYAGIMPETEKTLNSNSKRLKTVKT